MRVRNKDVETALLEAQLLTTQTKGPGTIEVKELRMKNYSYLSRILPYRINSNIKMKQMLVLH